MTPLDALHVQSRYWGKASPEVDSEGSDHHTVLGHSIDVAACAFVVVGSSDVVRTKLAAFWGIPTSRVAASAARICALHDIGKLDTRFQRKAGAIADRLRPESMGIASARYDHGAEGYRQVEDDAELSDRIVDAFGGGALDLLRAVTGHHGALPTSDDVDPSRTKLPGALRREDVRARRDFVGIIVDAFGPIGATSSAQDRVDGATVQLLAGLCALADWIGSNVDYFPYASGPIVDLDSYWATAVDRAREACAAAGLVRRPARSATFGELFHGFSPRDVQVATERVSGEVPALVIVEAEMGKGKTEAAIAMAARFLASGTADGATFALPTMATSNAMFGRIEEVVPRLFAGASVDLALAHSRADRHSGFRAVMSRAFDDPDAIEATVVCSRWLLNRKRVLLGQVGVGTIDQSLQAAINVRHQFVRLFALSRNVVIIDEVHAYDAYMEVLLEHLLRWLGALRVPVILLSATLPAGRRDALSRAWQGAREGESARGVTQDDSIEDAVRFPYPSVSVVDPARTVLHTVDVPTSTRTIAVDYRSGSEDLTEVARELVAAARAGARVAWIRNTVGEAQRAYDAVTAAADDVESVLFHSRFRGCDRSRVEMHVLERFGRRAPVGGRIVIATQVVEQSLDLDFDELRSDLAPVDLLLQRVGRLHRHDRVRLAGFERPRFVVYGPAERQDLSLDFGPSRFVYDEGTLYIAHTSLKERDSVALPTEIRALVEGTYHPNARSHALASAPLSIRDAESQRLMLLAARETNARRCCIDAPSHGIDGAATLSDDDDAVAAFTRDGKSATILVLAWDRDGARILEDGVDPIDLNPANPGARSLAFELLDATISIPARRISPARESSEMTQWRSSFTRFARDSGLGDHVVPALFVATPEGRIATLRVDGRDRSYRYTPTLGLEAIRQNQKEATDG